MNLTNAFFNGLLIESHKAVRSRWTLGLVVVMLIVIFYANLTSYQFALQGQDTMEKIKEIQGSNFKEWVLADDGARPLREAIWGLTPDATRNLFLAVLGAIGPMLSILWGANLVGSEFAWKTSRICAAHYGWPKTIVTKIVLIIIASIITVVMISVLSVVASQIIWHYAISSIEAAKWIRPPIIQFSLLKQVLALILGLSTYGLLGATLALLIRSTAAGSIIGLAAPFAEKVMDKWWLPQSAFSYMLNKQIVYSQGGAISPPPLTSNPPMSWYPWIIMLIWMTAFIFILWLASRRQEIV